MSDTHNLNVPDFDELRQEANERLQKLVHLLNNPEAPEWLKVAAELQLPALARLAGMKIPDGTEQ